MKGDRVKVIAATTKGRLAGLPVGAVGIIKWIGEGQYGEQAYVDFSGDAGATAWAGSKEGIDAACVKYIPTSKLEGTSRTITTVDALAAEREAHARTIALLEVARRERDEARAQALTSTKDVAVSEANAKALAEKVARVVAGAVYETLRGRRAPTKEQEVSREAKAHQSLDARVGERFARLELDEAPTVHPRPHSPESFKAPSPSPAKFDLPDLSTPEQRAARSPHVAEIIEPTLGGLLANLEDMLGK